MADPYLGLYGLIREAAEEVFKKNKSFFIGFVKEGLPNIEISLGDIVLYRDDFLISSSLITLNNSSITSTDTNIEHNLKDVLNIGDKVLLTQVEGTFILLEKVVSM